MDDLLHSFVERDEPLFSTSLSLRFITNESNQTLEMFASNGQYYLQLFSHGYFSADTVAGFRIRGPLCLATDKVLSVDCRMVSTDADVYQCFGETLQHFLHSPQQFGSTFPWLRSFLLRTLEVYYSQCSCDNMSIAEPSRLASAAKFAHGKPKEENARLQAIAQELSSGKSHISEIMQMSLSRLDFIPSSNTEYAMRQIHHYTRNSMDQTSRKIVSSRQTQEPRGECSNEDQYNDYENPILAKALFSLAENNILQANSVCGGGCDEQLLSSKTRNQNR